jgi:hypothetical protein
MGWVVNAAPQPLYPWERGVVLTVPVPVRVVITASGYSYSTYRCGTDRTCACSYNCKWLQLQYLQVWY